MRMTLLGVAMVLMAAGEPRGVAAAEIKVLTAGAFKQVLLVLVPEFEKQTGHKVILDNDTVGALTKRIEGGEGSNPRLGHLVLFSGSACRADRRRHRLVARLGGRRHLDRTAGRRADLAASWPHHRRARRAAGAIACPVLYAAGLAGIGLAPALPVYFSAGCCSALAWAPGSTTRCLPRLADVWQRRRARRSLI